MITLPEDVLLEGFPLISSAVKPIYYQKAEKKKSILLARLQVILDNGKKIFSAYDTNMQSTVHFAPQSIVNTKVKNESSSGDMSNQLTFIVVSCY